MTDHIHYRFNLIGYTDAEPNLQKPNAITDEDFFALAKGNAISSTNNTADQFDAKVDTNGVLTIYLYSDMHNTASSTDAPLVNSNGSTLDLNTTDDTGYVYADNEGAPAVSGTPGTPADRRVDSGYLTYNQAAHIVWGGTTDIDKNGRGGALYDMAHNDTSAVKFISTGADKVETLNIGIANDANTTLTTEKAEGKKKIARVEAYNGAVTTPTIVTSTLASTGARHS